MFDFGNYKIFVKLFFVISLLFILIVSIMSLALLSIENIKAANAQKSLIRNIDKYASDIIFDEKSYLDTFSDYYLSLYTTDINNLVVSFKALYKQSPNNEDIAFILKMLDDHMQKYFAISDSIKESIAKGYNERTVSKMTREAKIALAKEHEEFYSVLIKFNKKYEENIDARVKSVENGTNITFAVLGFATLLIVVFVVRGVNSLIVMPVTRLSEKMKQIGVDAAGLASYKKIEIKSHDEVGALANSFNQMAENLLKTTVSRDDLSREVEERKRAEEKIASLFKVTQAANEKLSKMDKTKDEFLSIVTHDLKTPLTSLSGYADLILSGIAGEITKEQRSYIEIIKKQSSSLEEMIDTILDYTRLEFGTIKVNKDNYNMNSQIMEAVEAIKPLADKSKISIEINLIPENLNINADRGMIKRVITNFIGNSLKYTKEGGKIGVSLTKIDDEAKVSVMDNGKGISKENLSKVFEKFYMVDNATAREKRSMGLGLYIASKFIEAHNGKIWSESEGEGKGSTFNFTIPMA